MSAFGFCSFSIFPAKPTTSANPRQPPRCVAEPISRTAKLPQGATPVELAERAEELRKTQQLYAYESPPNIPGIPFIRSPIDHIEQEQPSLSWTLKVSAARAKRKLNFSFYDVKAALAAIEELRDGILGNQKPWREMRVVAERDNAVATSAALAEKIERTAVDSSTLPHSFEEDSPFLEPYREMYKVLDYPEIADVFMDDEVFARLRVAGYNPLTLFAVTSEEKMPFTFSDDKMPLGDSVRKAIDEKRLYAMDFSFMERLEQQANSVKRFAITKALFVVAQDSRRGDLTPLAIEVNGELALPPTQGDKFPTQWTIAKLAVNSCDTIHHQVITHLGSTHLRIEPFIAATMRQLPSTHPLHMLLRPHFEGTASINDGAAIELTAPGGPVDMILGGDLASAMRYCGEYVQNMKFNSGMPDVELKERGLMNDVLYMPYRDDALAHWEAINEWVYEYMSCFYTSDAEIQKDHELQAWIAELIDPARGQVKEFGNNGDGIVRDVRYLARAVAFVIFTGSVQHAAVNFPQATLMMYPPAVPGFLWGEPHVEDEFATIDAWRRLVMPIQNVIEQIDVFHVLGTVYHTELGEYERGALPDVPGVEKALRAYKRRLHRIDRKIARRERREVLKYEYMRPRNIPQSTNI